MPVRSLKMSFVPWHSWWTLWLDSKLSKDWRLSVGAWLLLWCIHDWTRNISSSIGQAKWSAGKGIFLLQRSEFSEVIKFTFISCVFFLRKVYSYITSYHSINMSFTRQDFILWSRGNPNIFMVHFLQLQFVDYILVKISCRKTIGFCSYSKLRLSKFWQTAIGK